MVNGSPRKNTKHLPMTPEAEAIDQMEWRGNITPSEWFMWLKFPNGKTDSLACLILSEIVYWYRGSEVWKDGAQVPGLRSRKFHGDLLQKGYADLVGKFGITKRQAQDAMGRLEKAGVIAREFRNLRSKGQIVNNVLYIRIFPERIREITYSVPEKYREPAHVSTGSGPAHVPQGHLSR